MKIVNMHQAKTQLSKLVERVRRGEEIWIGKAGQPVAKLTAFDLPNKPRQAGLLKGKIKMGAGFDKLPAWLSKAFNNPSL